MHLINLVAQAADGNRAVALIQKRLLCHFNRKIKAFLPVDCGRSLKEWTFNPSTGEFWLPEGSHDTALAVHRNQELLVVACLVYAVFHEFHGFYRRHVGKVAAQNIHAVEHFRAKQHVLFARARSD